MANYIIDSLDFDTGNYFTLTTPYGTCSTAQATVAKVVDCDNFAGATLVAGAKITVKFAEASVAAATLNVEGTGAKPIFYRGSAATTSTWKANDTISFVFDGINWVVEGHVGIDGDEKTGYQSISTAAEYPVLFKPSTGTTTTSAKAGFDTTLTFNPSTNAMTLPGILNICNTTAPDTGSGITIKKCGNKDCAFTFDYDGSGTANWRMAYLGSGSGDANKLAFQSTASANGSTYNTALDLSMDNRTATFYGNVVVASGKTLKIGNTSITETQLSQLLQLLEHNPALVNNESHTYNENTGTVTIQ